MLATFFRPQWARLLESSKFQTYLPNNNIVCLPELTFCGLMMLYGDIDWSQHWLRWWLVAWWHRAITLTNVDLSSEGTCTTYLTHWGREKMGVIFGILGCIFLNEYFDWDFAEFCSQGFNRMAWQWTETLVELRGTLADIRGTTKYGIRYHFPKHEFNRPVCLEAHHYLLAHHSQ